MEPRSHVIIRPGIRSLGAALLPLLLMALGQPARVQAAFGIFETYAIINPNGAGTAFYDAGANTGNPDYQGANFGVLNPALNSLILNGGEVKSFKNGGSDVTGASLFYRIYSGAPSGPFAEIGLPFNADLVTAGDQKWQATGANINLLNGLGNGNYTLEIYFTAFGNGSTVFDSRGGLNYQASFSVVPEPTSTALLVVGFVGVIGVGRQWFRHRRALSAAC